MYLKIEVEEEVCVMDYQQTMENDGMMATIKEEEPSPDIGTDGSSKRNPPERCPRPLYSWNSTQEDHTAPHHDQDEELKNIKAEIKEEEEETLVSGAQQSMEEGEMIMKSKQEESSLHIDTNGSSKRNPPEGCPSPLYSRDSAQEDLTIPHHDQDEELKNIKAEIKEEEEETLVSGAQQSMEEGEMMVKTKQEESSLHIDTNGFSKRNPPERCPRPLYSRDSTQEDLTIPHHDQDEELKNIKAEIKEEEEETLVSGAQQSMEEGEMIMKSKQEESSLHIDTSLHSVQSTLKEIPISSPDYGTGDNDIAQYSSGVKPVTRSMHCRSNHVDESRVLFNPEESSDRSHADVPNINPEPQFEDGSSDTSSSEEPSPNKSRTVKRRRNKMFPCPKCDKCFNRRSHLLRHHNQHTGRHPYSCPECKKSFRDNVGLVEHQRVHSDERPFSCSECGKCFKRRSYLTIHLRVHTGESPFSCSECGKCYKEKGTLNRHQRTHTGLMPHTCAECGKSFIRKNTLLKHERTHTGERPFSCLECGKQFKQKYCLAQHLKLHNDSS